jgi:DNA-binding MurR/RpiR family transcriptional regulator
VSVEQRLEEIIRSAYPSLKPAEKAVADYFLARPTEIPFESNGTIAARVGVSEMSVIRFIRSLGFKSLRDLKEKLRERFADGPWDLDDVMERFHVHPAGMDHLQRSLELQLNAIVRAYQLTVTDQWNDIVALLAHSQNIFVTGFQTSKGHALDFVSRLAYARTGAIFVEGTTGTFSEILESDASTSVLMIVDTYRYARRSFLLANAARTAGIPLIIVTDKYAEWGQQLTPFVLAGYTQVSTFFDSGAAIETLLGLLIDSVAVKLGAKAEEQYARMARHRDYFQEFQDVLPSRNKSEK